MELTIIEEKYNTLIGRREIKVLINHLGEVTPTRESIRSKIAAKLNVDLEHVVIQSVHGHFGEPMSYITIHSYDEAKDALIFEQKYRLKRNKIIEEQSEG